MLLIIVVTCYIGGINGILYDSFEGKPLTKLQRERYEEANVIQYCTNDIKPCDPNEGRREDGSCNNMKYPTRGAIHTPLYRVLPPVHSGNYESRKSKLGAKLPLVRYIRTFCLSTGKAISLKFTQLAVYYFLYILNDVGMHWYRHKSDCCGPNGKEDPLCSTIEVPSDDPVHRFTNIRCMNSSKQITFQHYGCIKNGSAFERLQLVTPTFDISPVYNNKPNLIEKIRLYKNGLIKFEIENGKIWPPKSKKASNECVANKAPKETRCHDTLPNGVFGANLLNIWFYRQHNHLAGNLLRVNPCWDDETLYRNAREMNIAIMTEIFLYELLPLFMGKQNLMKDGILSRTGSYRDEHRKNAKYFMSEEFVYMLYWFHTVQSGEVLMYKNSCNVTYFPLANLTSRTGFLSNDDNMEQITRGCIRQPSAGIDHISDPSISETAFGELEEAIDLIARGFNIGREIGFASYVKYREFCSKTPIKSFNDLKNVMDPERIEILKRIYKNVEDIDMMVGAWSENTIKGGHVPHTFYCLVVEQLKRTIKSDRHWYERQNRPNAFTPGQLRGIRNATLAGMMCLNADGVDKIQPHVFLVPGPGNEMRSCNQIMKIDFNNWKDSKCDKQ